jgi:hypothetical protein
MIYSSHRENYQEIEGKGQRIGGERKELALR